MTKTKRVRAFWIAGILAAAFAVLFLIWKLRDPYALPRADWKIYKKDFIDASGRVIDTGNENITHSESQGYGMLLAEAYGDRKTFESIWEWTRGNLQTRPKDKLLSWIWKPATGETKAGVADPNNASDGDILVAWALLRASKRWKEYAYQQAAVQILVDLKRLDVMETNGLLVLLPGTDGFREKEGGVVINPSYYIFPALKDFAKLLPGTGWDQVARDGLRILSAARFGIYDLCPDWLQLGIEISIAPEFPPEFGYNAVRIPLNIAWGGERAHLLAPYVTFWENNQPIPATVNLQTNAFGPHPALPGMEAIALFSDASYRDQRITVADIPPLEEGESYYSASLKLLTKIAIRDSFRAPAS